MTSGTSLRGGSVPIRWAATYLCVESRAIENLAYVRYRRHSARNDSDVDVLVAFDGPATSKRYFGVQFYLEDLLGCPVDLLTEEAMRTSRLKLGHLRYRTLGEEVERLKAETADRRLTGDVVTDAK